jgi:hypothetical protein
MAVNSDLVLFPHYRRTPPSLDAVADLVNHLIVEGMVSVNRPFNVRLGYHRWAGGSGNFGDGSAGNRPIMSLSDVREAAVLDSRQLRQFLAENRVPLERSPDLRISFKASSWLFYESVLRRLCILWDEVWPPAIHIDITPEPMLLWDRLRAGWEVLCPDCGQLLYHSRDGTRVGWFRNAPTFPSWQPLAQGRCPDPDGLVECFRCGKDYAFRELVTRVPRNSCTDDTPNPMPIYRMCLRVGGGGTWIGVGYKPSERMDVPALRTFEGILGMPLRHFDDWY